MYYTDMDCAIVLIPRQYSGPDYVCVVYDRTKTTLENELNKAGIPVTNKMQIQHLAQGIKDCIVNEQRHRFKRNN